MLLAEAKSNFMKTIYIIYLQVSSQVAKASRLWMQGVRVLWQIVSVSVLVGLDDVALGEISALREYQYLGASAQFHEIVQGLG